MTALPLPWSGAPAHGQLSGTLAFGSRTVKEGERRLSEDKPGIEISALRRGLRGPQSNSAVSQFRRFRNMELDPNALGL